MNWNIQTCLELFGPENALLLRQGLHGLEKESLRVNPDGTLALTPHPAGLGSPLENPNITTDFSESQIEFITDPHPSIEDMLFQLDDLHEQVKEQLNGELLWPLSMPCILPEKEKIPIAFYGHSEEAQRREKYREGLAFRYGKTMQMLCGIHYNFSFTDNLLRRLHERFASDTEFQDFKNERYLGLVRNFARYRWLLVALFGAAPLCDESYKCKAAEHNKGVASSLRMSKCGYSNPTKIEIDYNSFKGHTDSIEKAMNTHHAPYEGHGLNANLIQIPNEYYFSIRLKPSPKTPNNLVGLQQEGVEYIEVRLFDINPFEPLGVTANQLRFTQMFLLACLFSESPKLDEAGLQEATRNQESVAIRGRKPDLKLQRKGEEILMSEWMEEVFDIMQPIADLMGTPYTETLAAYTQSDTHLAERIVEAMGDDSHVQFGLRLASQ